MPGPFDAPVTFDDVEARIDAVPVEGGPEAMRTAFAQLVRGDAAGGPVPEATSETWGGVDALRLGGAGGDAVAVWFHGGGYVFGSPETHVRPATAFAEALGVPVVLPRYRLAPEHVWPAQRDDALAAVRALQDASCRVVLAGDSAGGHLALVTALALAGEGSPAGAIALFSPNTDRTGLSETRQAATPRDPMNADANDRRLAEMTFRDRPDDDPEVSPVLADLNKLPRTHIEVGGREVLLGDSLRLAERACASGAELSLHLTADAFHMWQLWTPWLPEANTSIRRAAEALAGWR